MHDPQQLAQRPDSFQRGASVGHRHASQVGTWSRTYGLLMGGCMSFLARRRARRLLAHLAWRLTRRAVSPAAQRPAASTWAASLASHGLPVWLLARRHRAPGEDADLEGNLAASRAASQARGGPRSWLQSGCQLGAMWACWCASLGNPGLYASSPPHQALHWMLAWRRAGGWRGTKLAAGLVSCRLLAWRRAGCWCGCVNGAGLAARRLLARVPSRKLAWRCAW